MLTKMTRFCTVTFFCAIKTVQDVAVVKKHFKICTEQPSEANFNCLERL